MQIVSKKCRTTAGCLNYLFILVAGASRRRKCSIKADTPRRYSTGSSKPRTQFTRNSNYGVHRRSPASFSSVTSFPTLAPSSGTPFIFLRPVLPPSCTKECVADDALVRLKTSRRYLTNLSLKQADRGGPRFLSRIFPGLRSSTTKIFFLPTRKKLYDRLSL